MTEQTITAVPSVTDFFKLMVVISGLVLGLVTSLYMQDIISLLYLVGTVVIFGVMLIVGWLNFADERKKLFNNIYLIGADGDPPVPHNLYTSHSIHR